MKISKIIKTSAIFIVSIFAVSLFSICAFATGTADFSIPDDAVKKGETVSIPINITTDSNIGLINANVSYDDSILQFQPSDNVSGGGGVLNINAFPDSPSKSMTVTLKFKALSDGVCNVNLTNCNITSDDGTLIGSPTAYANITVAGTADNYNENDQSNNDNNSNPEEKLGDPDKGYLTNITVSNGTLKPAFAYDVYDYYVEVDNSVDICEIVGTPANATDYIWYTGNEDLAVGKNVRTIKVTDTEGYYHIYTITITRAETDSPESNEDEISSNNHLDTSSQIPVIVEESDNRMDNFKDIIIPAMLIVLATILIAAVVIIVWLRKKKKNDNSDAETPDYNDKQTNDYDDFE